jgi:hypothetical protein
MFTIQRNHVEGNPNCHTVNRTSHKEVGSELENIIYTTVKNTRYVMIMQHSNFNIL